MRDDEIRRILTDSNPWWEAGVRGDDALGAVRGHRVLRSRVKYDLGYRAGVLEDLATSSLGDSLVVLTGPRRVGKSVALLDLLERLCGRGDVSPFQLIYVPCDGMQTRDIRRAFILGREATRVVDRDAPKPRAWLLDEVTGISGWAAAVKGIRDSTVVGDDTVVATGSRWRVDEDIEGNLFAGRAGTTGARRLRHLLPMSFREYLAAARPELKRLGPVHPSELQTAGVSGVLDRLRFLVDHFDLAWQDYLICGGYPRAVAEHARDGGVSAAFTRDVAASLRGDVDPGGVSQSLPLLMDALTTRATSPLNMNNVAKALGWTRPVLTGRIHRLVASFGAVWCHQVGDGGARVAGAQSKLYLADPLLAWLPSRLRSGLDSPDMTSLTEQAIGVALARAVDALEEGRWIAGDTIGYAKTRAGNEIDFAPVPVPAPGGQRLTVPVEGKWVDDRWRGESLVVENRFGAGILATKSILDLDHPVWAVPAPLVALLLE